MKLCGLSPGPWLKWSHHLIIFAESFLLILVMGNRLESLSYIMTSTLCVHFIYKKKRTGRFHFPFDSVNGRASSFIIGKESLSAVEKGIGLFIINAHCCWVVHFFFFFLPVFSLSLLRMKAKSQEIQSTLDPREEKVRLRRLILIGELGIKVNRLPHTHADRDKNILKTSAVSLFCNMKFIEFPFFFFVGYLNSLGRLMFHSTLVTVIDPLFYCLMIAEMFFKFLFCLWLTML